jgi:hypothetical protein
MSAEQTIIKNQQTIIQQNDFIIKMLKAALPDAGKNLWMNEADVMRLMNISKRSLYTLRMDPKRPLEWRYAHKGRGIQYQRKSVEKYLEQNSTLAANKLKVA